MSGKGINGPYRDLYLGEMRWRIQHGQSELRSYFQTLDDGDHLVAISVREVSPGEVCASVQVSGCSSDEEAKQIVKMLKADLVYRITARDGVKFDAKAYMRTNVENAPNLGWTAICLIGMFATTAAAMTQVPLLQAYGIDLMTPGDSGEEAAPAGALHA
jgi:hypothetical protein